VWPAMASNAAWLIAILGLSSTNKDYTSTPSYIALQRSWTLTERALAPACLAQWSGSAGERRTGSASRSLNAEREGGRAGPATGACHSINWRIPATGLRRFCLASSVRRSGSHPNLARARASDSSPPS
jgi:hypothetical protein